MVITLRRDDDPHAEREEYRNVVITLRRDDDPHAEREEYTPPSPHRSIIPFQRLADSNDSEISSNAPPRKTPPTPPFLGALGVLAVPLPDSLSRQSPPNSPSKSAASAAKHFSASSRGENHSRSGPDMAIAAGAKRISGHQAAKSGGMR